jgi:rod shape-determining protein MreC
VTDQRILVLRTALLWILLELLAAAQVRSTAGELVLWEWARATVAPVLFIGNTVGMLVGGAVSGVSDSADLIIDNNRLRIELETAQTMNLILDEDLAALRELDALAAMVPDLAALAVPARTTYRDLQRGRMIVQAGGDRRISPDASAVASGGVIGRVIRSDGHRCWIELITNPVAAAAVQTADGRVRGLAVGSDSGELEIQFVPRQAELLRGDELVTSGADGIHPPGLPLGRVISVRESDRAFLDVRAEPATTLATTRVVLLIDNRWAPVHAPDLEP